MINPRDPLFTGQLMGILTILTFIKEKEVSDEFLEVLKLSCVENLEGLLEKPAEDIYLLVDNIIKDIEAL